MIRILLLEDSPEAVEVLNIHLATMNDLGILTANYASVSAFLEDIKAGHISYDDFDVLFLDIELEGSINGYEFLKSNKRFDKPVVVVSSYPEKYSLEGYRYEVKDFMPKPIGPDGLKQCLIRLSEMGLGKVEGIDKFPIEVGSRTFYLDLAEVIMFRRNDKYSYYFTSEFPPKDNFEENSRYRLRKSLSDLESVLPKGKFKRVSKSAIVNLDYLYSSSNSRIELQYKDLEGHAKQYGLDLTSKEYQKGFFQAIKGLFYKSKKS